MRPALQARAGLLPHFDIDVALSTINDSVLRVGETVEPIIDWMKRDLLAGKLHPGRRNLRWSADGRKNGRNQPATSGSTVRRQRAWFSTSEMTRSKEVPKTFSRLWRHSSYGWVCRLRKDIAQKSLISRFCLAPFRRKFHRGHQGADQGPCRDPS